MASTFSLTGKLGLDARGFVQGAKQAENAIGDVSDEMNDLPDQAGKQGSKAGGLLSSNLAKGFAMAGGVAALTAGFKATIDAASNLEESTNAVGVAFGEAGAEVLALGENSVDAFGLSQRAFNEAAVGFSSFAAEIADANGGKTADTLNDLMTRATDMASVFNVSVPDAAEAMRSALSGEAEPMKRFGIVMSEAKIEAYALSEGIIESGESMNDAQKQAARYGFIMQATANVQGDWANTSDGFAGAQKKLGAELEDLAAVVGEELLPALADMTNQAVDALETIQKYEEPLKRAAKTTLGMLNPLGMARDGFFELKDAVTGSSEAVEENTEASEINAKRSADYQAATEAAAKAQEDAAQSEEDRKKAIDANVAALREIKTAQDAARQATEEARMAQMEAIDSSLAYRNQQADTAAAIRDGTAAMNDATLSADEQAQASRDVEAAVLDQASAALKLAEDQAEANGRTLTAEEKTRIYKQELQNLAGYLTGDARTAVQGYIDDLNGIPSTISTSLIIRSMTVSSPSIGQSGVRVDSARAAGGPVGAGRTYLVGEEGPELFTPNMGGQIIDAVQTAALFGRSVGAPAAQPVSSGGSPAFANGSGVTINHYGPNLNASDVSRGYTLARLAQV